MSFRDQLSEFHEATAQRTKTGGAAAAAADDVGVVRRISEGVAPILAQARTGEDGSFRASVAQFGPHGVS